MLVFNCLAGYFSGIPINKYSYIYTCIVPNNCLKINAQQKTALFIKKEWKLEQKNFKNNII